MPGSNQRNRSPQSSYSNSRSDKVIRLDNEVSILTPEYIQFQFRAAGPVRRALALILDVVLIFAFLWAISIIVSLLTLLFGILVRVAGLNLDWLFELFAGLGEGFALVLLFLLWWFSGAFLESWYNGQTIGKRVTRIRVVGVDGRAISLFQAFVRNFLRLADAVPFFPLIFLFPVDITFPESIQNLFAFLPTFLVGLAIMLLNQKMQRLGDICAGTMVVHVAEKRHESLPVFDDLKLLQLAGEIPNSFSPTASLTDCLALYVGRRNRFHQERLDEIASHLVEPLVESWGWKSRKDFDLVAGAIYVRCIVDPLTIQNMIEEKKEQQRKSGMGDGRNVHDPLADIPVSLDPVFSPSNEILGNDIHGTEIHSRESKLGGQP